MTRAIERQWGKGFLIGKILFSMNKNDTDCFPNIIHRNQVKVDKRSQHETHNKLLRGPRFPRHCCWP